MSKLTAAYMAGYIDGEGYLGIMKSNRHPTTVAPTYMPVIKVTSTDESIIIWFKESFGGHMDKRVFVGNSKDAYTWTLTGQKLKRFIEKVYPYLKLKKPQADLLKKRLRMYRLGYRYTPEEGRIMEEQYIQIRKLNKRGKN